MSVLLLTTLIRGGFPYHGRPARPALAEEFGTQYLPSNCKSSNLNSQARARRAGRPWYDEPLTTTSWLHGTTSHGTRLTDPAVHGHPARRFRVEHCHGGSRRKSRQHIACVSIP